MSSLLILVAVDEIPFFFLHGSLNNFFSSLGKFTTVCVC